MKLASVVIGEQNKIVSKIGEQLVDLKLAYEAFLRDQGDRSSREIAAIRIPDSMIDFIAGGEKSMTAASEGLKYAAENPEITGAAGEKIFLAEEEVMFLAAIPRPNKLLHIGVTNKSFLKVMYGPDREQQPPPPFPKRPMMFQKANSAVVADGDDIVLMPHSESQLMTTEVEVGVIIGKAGRMIPMNKAFDHIFGYVVVNDITAQDRTDLFVLGDKSIAQLIKRGGPVLPTENDAVGGQHLSAAIIEMKNYDSWLPMGRFLVTKDEVEDPDNLRYETKVNGKVVQEGGSWDLETKTAHAVAAYSRIMTLEPGDVICTGTVALSADAVLEPGITLTSTVEGVGTMTNKCIAWEDRWGDDYSRWEDILGDTVFMKRSFD